MRIDESGDLHEKNINPRENWFIDDNSASVMTGIRTALLVQFFVCRSADAACLHCL